MCNSKKDILYYLVYPERLGAKIDMFNTKIECQKREKGKIREQTKAIMRIWILCAKHEIYYFVHSTIIYGMSTMYICRALYPRALTFGNCLAGESCPKFRFKMPLSLRN